MVGQSRRIRNGGVLSEPHSCLFTIPEGLFREAGGLISDSPDKIIIADRLAADEEDPVVFFYLPREKPVVGCRHPVKRFKGRQVSRDRFRPGQYESVVCQNRILPGKARPALIDPALVVAVIPYLGSPVCDQRLTAGRQDIMGNYRSFRIAETNSSSGLIADLDSEGIDFCVNTDFSCITGETVSVDIHVPV